MKDGLPDTLLAEFWDFALNTGDTLEDDNDLFFPLNLSNNNAQIRLSGMDILDLTMDTEPELAAAQQKNLALKAQIENLIAQWREQLHVKTNKLREFVMLYEDIERNMLISAIHDFFYLPGDLLAAQLVEQLKPEQTQNSMPRSELEKTNNENIKLEKTVALFISSIEQLNTNLNQCFLLSNYLRKPNDPSMQINESASAALNQNMSNTQAGINDQWKAERSSASNGRDYVFFDETPASVLNRNNNNNNNVQKNKKYNFM